MPQILYKAFRELPAIPSGHPLLKKCYLCGSNQDLTVEHVVPKVVFAPHTPGSYVKLATCRPCNTQKGKDEEYVTRFLQAGGFSDVARAGFEKAIEGFMRPGREGLRHDMIQRLAKAEVKIHDGPTGTVDIIKLDKKRSNDFILRIAKGLWVRNTLRHFGWDLYQTSIGLDQALQDTTLWTGDGFKKIWRDGQFGQYWQHAFAYRGSCANDDASMFYSSYFAAAAFVKTTPKK